MNVPKLPIYNILESLVKALRDDQAVVLSAPTGSGKSTVVPTALLDAGIAGQNDCILLLEPRRVAARACAARMAANLKETVGDTVGYQIRFEKKYGNSTRVLVTTEGILTRRFISDPFLEGVSILLLDEFHERSVHSDLALAFARELLEAREDFRLLVMSATLDTQRISAYLNGCPIIEGNGSLFPVTIDYLERIDERPLIQKAVSATRRALQKAPENGDVLVFMPGAGTILKLVEALNTTQLPGKPDVLPLYGALPHVEQDKALTLGSTRRVIVATNIAETSLTIPKVTAVVDCGLQKVNRYDPVVGLDRLETVAISRQSATQRAGRAGRTAPGYVSRLWTEHEGKGRAECDTPEIRRVDSTPVLLQMLAFHPGNPFEYPLLDTPNSALMEQGVDLLRQLGALEPEGFALTDKGKQLAALPLHPRLGAILLYAAKHGILELGATVVALASERDIYRLERGTPLETSPLAVDFDYRVELLSRFEQMNGTYDAARRLSISHFAARFALKAKNQYQRAAFSMQKNKNPHQKKTPVGRLLLSGFPDRVCKRRKPGDVKSRMVGGRGVHFTTKSDTLGSDLFVAVSADAGIRGSNASSRVFLASPLTYDDLFEVYPESIANRSHLLFDAAKRAVKGEEQTLFMDLVVNSKPLVHQDDAQTGSLIAKAAIEHWDSVFKPNKRAESLIARLRFASRALPDTQWPDTSDKGLQSLLVDLCYGKRSLKEVEEIDWFKILRDLLPYEQISLLDEECPHQFETPAGNSVVLDYEAASRDQTQTPVLACRIQALFGLLSTPLIAKNTIPLTIHLLAPNGRPAQQTQDLKSFWINTYPQVRKELKGRYPKHYWPQDPFTATPTSRVRPKGF